MFHQINILTNISSYKVAITYTDGHSKYILLKQSVGSAVPLTLELHISYPCIYVHAGSRS